MSGLTCIPLVASDIYKQNLDQEAEKEIFRIKKVIQKKESEIQKMISNFV